MFFELELIVRMTSKQWAVTVIGCEFGPTIGNMISKPQPSIPTNVGATRSVFLRFTSRYRHQAWVGAVKSDLSSKTALVGLTTSFARATAERVDVEEVGRGPLCTSKVEMK